MAKGHDLPREAHELYRPFVPLYLTTCRFAYRNFHRPSVGSTIGKFASNNSRIKPHSAELCLIQSQSMCMPKNFAFGPCVPQTETLLQISVLLGLHNILTIVLSLTVKRLSSLSHNYQGYKIIPTKKWYDISLRYLCDVCTHSQRLLQLGHPARDPYGSCKESLISHLGLLIKAGL